jgi:hypothetical protein
MKITDLNKLITNLNEEIGDALLSSMIMSLSTGQAVVKYKSDDRVAALMSSYTSFLEETVDKAGLGRPGDFFTINLVGNIQGFILMAGDYAWQITVDANQVPMGMIMSALLPECISEFKKAI